MFLSNFSIYICLMLNADPFKREMSENFLLATIGKYTCYTWVNSVYKIHESMPYSAILCMHVCVCARLCVCVCFNYLKLLDVQAWNLTRLITTPGWVLQRVNDIMTTSKLNIFFQKLLFWWKKMLVFINNSNTWLTHFKKLHIFIKSDDFIIKDLW